MTTAATMSLDDNKKMKPRKVSSHQHNHKDLKQQHVNYDNCSNNNNNKYQLLQDCTRHQDNNRQVAEKKSKASSSCNNHIVRPFKLFLIFLQVTCQILIIANVISNVHWLTAYNSFSSVSAHLILPKVVTSRLHKADRRFGFGGAGASVDIALEKVPEKQSADGQYGYGGGQAKKKFPITWLRNQYPFNKKKKSKYAHVNLHHQQQEQLYGQYSNQQYDVLDPNPSTWVKLTPPSQVQPIKPVQPGAFFLQPAPVSPVQQLSNLHSVKYPAVALPLAAQPVNVAPNVRPYPLAPTNDVMQFSSSDQIIQQQYTGNKNQFAAPLNNGRAVPHPAGGARGRPRGAGPQAGDATKGADSAGAGGAAGDGYGGGFGGVSLQFGNGRSISFGGGQGLTIGTKAGAISIGGKGGGSEGGSGETLASQGSHSDGYSSGGGRTISIGGGRGITIGGGSNYDTSDSGGDYATSGGSGSYGDNSSSGYGNNKYYKKNYKPTMSIEMPKKGKTVIHADLDMAPIKVKLHSSPRVKITTGSRDPLERPSDEEQEPEEDIFEPPEPFPKANSTSGANDTSLANSTSAFDNSTTNGANATHPLNGTTHLFDNGQFVDDYYYGNNRKQQHYGPLTVNGYQQVSNQQFSYDAHQQQQQQQQHYNHHHNTHANNQFQSGSPAPPFNPYHTPSGHLPPFNHVQQQQQHQQPQQHAHDQPNYHQHWQDQVDNLNHNHHVGQDVMPPIHANEQHAQQHLNQPPTPVDDRRPPALAQWRQFSKEAKNNLPRPNHHDSALDADHDRFYSHSDQPKPVPTGNSVTPNSMQAGAPSFDDHPYDPARPALMENGPHLPVHPASPPGPKQPIWGPIVELPNNSLDNSSARQHNVHLANTRYQIGNGQPIFDADYSSSDNVKSYALKPSESQHYPLTSKHYHEQQQQQVPAHDLYQQPGSGRYQQSNYVGAPSAHNTHQDYAPVQQAQYDADNQSSGPAYSSNNAAKSYHSVAGKSAGYSSQPDLQAKYAANGYAPSSSGYGSNSAASSSSYGGNAYGNGAGNGYSNGYGDGYNKNDYATKVEKYEPGAHDKRERSKVILFLKPRISIHQANSSTTTKRPKNRQRLLHVINKPIFLNNTGNYTHDDEWMDPDLKDTSGYGYGYGHGYGNGYGRDYSKSNSTTTKKPKTTTTTTSTTTTVSPDGDSSTTTTESSSTSEGTTTTDSTSDSSSSSTTEPTTTTTGSGDGDTPSSSTTEGSSSSSGTTLEVEGEPSSSTETSGSSTTETSGSSTTEKEEPSSTTSTSTSTSTTEAEEEEEEPSTTTSTTTTTTTASSVPPKKKKTKQGSTTTTSTTTTTELPLEPLEPLDDDLTTAASTTTSTTTQSSNDQSSVDIFASTSSPLPVAQSSTSGSTSSSTSSPVPEFDANPSEEEASLSSSSTTSMKPPTMTRRAMTSKPPPPPALSQRQQTQKTSAKVILSQATSQASNNNVQQQASQKQAKQAQEMTRKSRPTSTTTTTTSTTSTTTTTEQPVTTTTTEQPVTTTTTSAPEPTTTLLSGILTSEDGQAMSTTGMGNDGMSFTQLNDWPDAGSMNSISTPETILSQLPNSNSNEQPAVANADPGASMSDIKSTSAFTSTTTPTTSSGEINDSLDSTTTAVSLVPDASAIVSSGAQQPMLLNDELIDKLMRNKTLVNLMSNQLMKVMNTSGEKVDNDEKMNLVRLVFNQMMLKKVDFSSNNVRLAVKTVSSSYKEALEKSGASSPVSVGKANDKIKSTRFSSDHHRSRSNSFGQRVQPSDDSNSEAGSNSRSSRSSKSIRAIDTALRLTSNGNRRSGSSSRGNQDNPIVVVLLPQEKAR